MNETTYVQLLDLACGVFLLAAVLVLWRRRLAAIVRLFAIQGAALAGLVAVLAVHQHDAELGAVAVGILLLRAIALPILLRRALQAAGETRETQPLVNVAALLLGFFVLVTRHRALSQLAGFLLMDNGITAAAFLTTAGVPLVVELGVSFDVLLAVLVLQVLTTRMRAAFGSTDLDEPRELHD